MKHSQRVIELTLVAVARNLVAGCDVEFCKKQARAALAQGMGFAGGASEGERDDFPGHEARGVTRKRKENR